MPITVSLLLFYLIFVNNLSTNYRSSTEAMRWEEAGTNYRGQATWLGARRPTMLRLFLSFSIVSLFVNSTNKLTLRTGEDTVH